MVTLQELVKDPLVQSATVIISSIFGAWVLEFLLSKTLAKAAQKTKTDVDDKIIELLRRPVFLSVLLLGMWWSAAHLAKAQVHEVLEVVDGVEKLGGLVAEFPFFSTNQARLSATLQTLLILLWSVTGTRIGGIVLTSLAAKERRRSVLQPRTLPVFDIFMRVIIIALAIYFVFLAWNIDLTAWIASAGILGVAFGFAAKDTLANLFSGIFILADGPYKVKDWIVLDNELRGEVTHIGIRSTRVLTPDDVEITIPNAIIANARVLNETGGPYIRQRLQLQFSVAYGSDVDLVRKVVIGAVSNVKDVLERPTPKTIFSGLGDSGLEFALWVWINDPRQRELINDRLYERIYKSLCAAEIEIPYPKQDVYIRSMPRAATAAAPTGSVVKGSE